MDDILVFSQDPMPIIEAIKKDYILKGVGVPEYYLGGDVIEASEVMKRIGVQTHISARTYVANSLDRLGKMLGQRPFQKASTPMVESYHPELEESPLLSSEDATKFRGLMGSANWIITLGRFDIAYAVNSLARYGMAPREGHMTAMKAIIE